MSETIERPWPGFWPRIGALVIDWLILGVPAVAIGTVAFDALASLGSAGRLIGLAAGLLYFGLLESRLGGGRSVGKRLLKLQVTGTDGALLSPWRGAVRALVKIAPFIVNGVNLPDDGSLAPILIVLVAAIILFGVGLAQLYLYLFNRPGRRLVHDLLAGSVVVRSGHAPEAAAVAPLHRAVASAIVGGVAVLLVGAALWVKTRPPEILEPLNPMMAAVQALPEVLDAGVMDNTTVMWTAGAGATKNRTLIITARLRRWPSDPDAEMRRVAEAVLRSSRIPAGRRLAINLLYGYELGFASGSRSYVGNKTPEEWLAGGPAKTAGRT